MANDARTNPDRPGRPDLPGRAGREPAAPAAGVRPGRAGRRALLGGSLAALSGYLGGCDLGGPAASALAPRGPQALQLAQLSWVLFAMAAAVFALVVGLLLLSVLRRRPAPEQPGPDLSPGGRSELLWIGGGGVALPVAVILVLLGLTFWAMPVLSGTGRAADLVIEVVGYQYWWEVRYPAHGVVTANELHVPAGRTLELRLTSVDVNHSFWVPQLHGKMDLIPGKTNRLFLQADEPGTYLGRCAEFCGLQHAQMALYVMVDSPQEFDQWLDNQRRPARQVADSLVQRGAQVFAREGCINCHRIRVGDGAIGGQSGEAPGPDLTHIASRRTIGAGTLENTRGNLGGWIVNSQGVKPGNKMPPMPMDGESLQSLLAYLESLE